ncbi:capsule assembly Wzi family protein [Marinobacter halotolerans]|uniref:capsule assembly Wzi family protein n=1 Tax=Marinobacter halotolerans TaxID=1569211 RepID=UPI001248D70C|nr:capsule assembly Wzi family protein [Marinobacter halotolerans]
MTSKHWTLVGGAVACLIVLTFASAATAAPWIEPGDPRARFAIQKLADRGHLDRVATTWPVSWANVYGGVDQSSLARDESVNGANAYLRFEMERNATPGFRAEAAISGTTEPAFLRSFAAKSEHKGELGLDLQWQGRYWAFGLSPSAAANPEDDDTLRFDGSYLAATVNNWVVGAGAIDRWWGPGWQHSLILSNNARPLPAVWLNRNETAAPETQWLQWVGPWQFSVFAGQLESDRVVPDAKLVGMRFAFRPLEGLDIGLSRMLMFGGEGRPENFSTLWDMLIGRDNSQGGAANDPGNQLGSVDVRYGFALGDQSMGLYTQMMGEDEAGAFPARKSWLFGTDWTSAFFAQDQQWYLEYANTLADDILGDPMPNITYDHFRYQTGYHYYGRSMGASIDGDAEALTFGVFNFFPDGSNLGVNITAARLNKDGAVGANVTDADVFAYLPKRDQNIAVLESSYGTQVFEGWLDLNASYTNKKLQFVGGEKGQWALSASWRYRF